MAGTAPVTRLALAFAAGAAWALAGAPPGLAPLGALLLLAVPKSPFGLPLGRLMWVMAYAAGLGSSLAMSEGSAECLPARMEVPATIEGRFLASPRAGSAPFSPEGGCPAFTVVATALDAPAGMPVRLEGVWREGRRKPWFLAGAATRVTGVEQGWRWSAVRWRDGIVQRLDRLYGSRAPLVSSLVLARREGLDPDLREHFARSGIAHLLAISGFHVGVIAGVLLSTLALLGVGARRAALLSATGSWLYVAFIGFPDAASRAAMILTAAAVARGRGRPAARWAAIGAAFLVLLALDPRRLAQPGFQLSFAGAAGLTAWAVPISRKLKGAAGGSWSHGLVTAAAAGVAATLATLPVVSWHFERVSLIGIPVTILATPLVTLGLIGSLGSIAVDFLSPELASILAGGVSTVLGALQLLAERAGSIPWASAWTTRATVVAGAMGAAAAWWTARRPRVGAQTRRVLTAVYVGAAVTAWPLLLALQGRGSIEILMIDVGQGDAIALRGPRGRWILVDAGPASADGRAAAHPVVRALRSRGVRRLEALVLTHPDLDHIGGAAAVLESFEVGVVYDPGLPVGKEAFVEVLEVATDEGVPWRAARIGDRIELDRFLIRVLYPPQELDPGSESNASSVVLHAALGSFDALLTGDAYKDVDRLVASQLPDVVEVLKVGHHGSDTSTDPMLLEATRPLLALVSVGRSNRYGHPAPEVLRRLDERGVDVRRTDRDGSISVLARSDGSFSVTSRR